MLYGIHDSNDRDLAKIQQGTSGIWDADCCELPVIMCHNREEGRMSVLHVQVCDDVQAGEEVSNHIKEVRQCYCIPCRKQYDINTTNSVDARIPGREQVSISFLYFE